MPLNVSVTPIHFLSNWQPQRCLMTRSSALSESVLQLFCSLLNKVILYQYPCQFGYYLPMFTMANSKKLAIILIYNF